MRACDQLEAGFLKDAPDNLVYRGGLGESRLRSGEARRDEGDTAGAVSDWRQSDALLEGVGELTPEYAFLHACCRSALSWAARLPRLGRGGSRCRGQRRQGGGAAPACSREGIQQPRHLPQRARPRPAPQPRHFRLLMMDLAFPAEPFTPGD